MTASILGISNLDYHADRIHLSSSSLKSVLHDPQQFFREYILNERVQSDADHFAEGSLVHSLILEPDKVATDYAIFEGLRKSGKLWEQFKAEHIGKTLISSPQMLRCERLLKAYNNMPTACNLIRDGFAEHNMTSTIRGVPVKARADYIVPQNRVIIDVKTTSMASDIDLFKQTVEQYSYHLSAALYCMIANDTYGGVFDFYWLVLSKNDGQCHIYKASLDTLTAGVTLVTKALHQYKKCLSSGVWVAERAKVDYNIDNYEILEV